MYSKTFKGTVQVLGHLRMPIVLHLFFELVIFARESVKSIYYQGTQYVGQNCKCNHKYC